jgi:broad specificity phosphatase PhoE
MPPKPKYIWLVRHAESRGNTGHECDIDPPLSPLGEDQARTLHRGLGHLTFTRVYVSPLKRARQTLELSGLPLDRVVFDSRIIEWRMEGAYEPYLPYPATPDYGAPDRHDAWRTPWSQRIAGFAREIARLEFEHILVVTHGGASIELTRAFLAGDDYAHGKTLTPLHYLHNTGIAQLRLSPDGTDCTLGIWNHTGHLGPLGTTFQSPP